MFNSPTVFVIGAGASADVGLPMGDGLRDKIISELDSLKIGRFSRLEGNQAIIDALNTRASEDQARGDHAALNHYYRAARRIRADLGLFRSIDEMVEYHGGDKYIEYVAKTIICWSILEAESRSTLLIGDEWDPKLDVGALRTRDAWLLELLHLLRGQAHVSHPEDIFDNVSFIVFNYDRVLEVFLILSLTSLSNLTVEKAHDIVNSLDIIHPYGRVSGFGAETDIGFGMLKNARIREFVDNIRTYGETERDEAEIERMHNLLSAARNVVFLGFAFHEQNLDFFKMDVSPSGVRFYATVYGVPEENWNDIKASVFKRVQRPRLTTELEMTFRACKGAELLRIYARPLTR